MRFAILAAGHGSRLAADGCSLPKPMTLLDGVPMIERLVRQALDCGMERVAVVINPQQAETVIHVGRLAAMLPIDVVEASTPSPMHSLWALSPYLKGHAFCAATVDTVFHASALKGLMEFYGQSAFDGIMGVTGTVDDEKPLWVRTFPDMQITAFLDERGDCRFASAGVYLLPPVAIDVLATAVTEGERRLRHFQRRLLDHGLRLGAFDMGQVVDVDHGSDIEAAVKMLQGS